jgi:hypothetical protein
MLVELGFQVMDTEYGKLRCTVTPASPVSTAAAFDVCRFEAHTGEYDGRACWFFLPAGATYRCERKGLFYFSGTFGLKLTEKLAAPAADWMYPVPQLPPSTGTGIHTSFIVSNKSDTWVTVTLAPTQDTSPESNTHVGSDASLECYVQDMAVCLFASNYHVNSTTCSFLVPKGATVDCQSGVDSEISVLSSLAIPLTRPLLSRTSASSAATATWTNLSCPFSGSKYAPNNCPCNYTGSETHDQYVHMNIASPDSRDNSIWCYASGGEDLCLLSWNKDAKDAQSCSFFLPAHESMACQIQFGTVNVQRTAAIPLSKNIFEKGKSAPPRHWDRIIGYGGRGPRSAGTAVDEVEAVLQWSEYRKKHKKLYASYVEQQTRFEYFKTHLRQIKGLRAAHPRATFGLNAFSDSSIEEWLHRATGVPPAPPAFTQNQYTASTASTASPTASSAKGIDWRSKGKVTPVKNQGQCGDCWAFSATATIESAWAINGNPLVSLSEEFLTDCDYPQSPGGCNGGFPFQAFEFVIKNGIDTERSYPFTGDKTAACTRHWPPTSPVRIQGWVSIPANESAMQEYVTAHTPVSIALDAGQCPS